MKLKKALKLLLETFSQQDVFLLKIRLSARAPEKSHYLTTNTFNAHVSFTHKEGFDEASLSNHFKVTDRTCDLILIKSKILMDSNSD